MDSATILAIVTSITTTIVTITGIIIKDRADQRRWEQERQISTARHAENVATLASNSADLQVVKTEVNGKMDKLVSVVAAAAERGGDSA